MRKSFAASSIAALLLALCAGAALAGNGHGGGNGYGNDGSQPQQQSQPSDSSHGGWQHSDQSQPQAAQPQTEQQPANSEGVKPSSTTKHDTHARADSSETKSYGNGKTAGQIATSRSASGDTMLHGPGNSQPHKVVACGHRHEVDVHAIKSYDSSSCNAQPKHEVAPAQTQPAPCTKTVTVTVPAGVWHDEGSKWVRGESKHAGDLVVDRATTKTITISDACKQSAGEVQAAAFQQAVSKCGHRVESLVEAQPEQKPAAVAPAQVEERKVYICHATGSATNPYVLIHVSKHAEWAHTHHQDERDVVLGDSAAAGCPAAAPAAVAAAQTCTCTTTTTPAAAAPATTTTAAAVAVQTATVVPPTQTVTVAPAATGGVAGTTAQTAAPVAQSAPTETTPAAGGVLGAQATIAPKQPTNSGVLGTTGRIASSRLPFTGIELWIFALVAAALIGAGLTLRRAGRGTL